MTNESKETGVNKLRPYTEIWDDIVEHTSKVELLWNELRAHPEY